MGQQVFSGEKCSDSWGKRSGSVTLHRPAEGLQGTPRGSEDSVCLRLGASWGPRTCAEPFRRGLLDCRRR